MLDDEGWIVEITVRALDEDDEMLRTEVATVVEVGIVVFTVLLLRAFVLNELADETFAPELEISLPEVPEADMLAEPGFVEVLTEEDEALDFKFELTGSEE